MGIEKIIWQPEFCTGYDFKIHLDADFAKKMIQNQVPGSNQRNLNKLANEFLKHLVDPYHFYEDTAFLRGIYLDSMGRWLATDLDSRNRLLAGDITQKTMEYNSHNVDCSADAHKLMVLFGVWINYSDLLIGK